MHFDSAKMRLNEMAYDEKLDPEKYIIVRLDGRNFSHVTESYKKPYSRGFQEDMVTTAEYLMQNLGVQITYAYLHSDEINLLLKQDAHVLGRKPNRILSIFASAASACLTYNIERVCVFDGRISQCANVFEVIEYFQWRKAMAQVNGLNDAVIYALKESGLNAKAAQDAMDWRTYQWKIDRLKESGTDWRGQSLAVRQGVALYWHRRKAGTWSNEQKKMVYSKETTLETDWYLPSYSKTYDSFLKGIIIGEDL